MNDKPPSGQPPAAPPSAVSPSPAAPLAAGARKSDPRAGERLAAALRDNLRRRKQQLRARRSDAGPAKGQGED